MIRIRAATEADARTLGALNLEVQAHHVAGEPAVYRPISLEEAEEGMRASLASGEYGALLALLDGEPAGYLIHRAQHREQRVYTHASAALLVDQLGVAAAARGRGVGRALMRAAEELAVAQQLSAVVLDVRAFNETARAFYEALGYRPLQTRMGRTVG